MANAGRGRRVTEAGALYLYGISRSVTADGAKPPAKLAAQSAKTSAAKTKVTKSAAAKKPINFSKIASAGIDGLHEVRPLASGEFFCWVSQVDHAGFSAALEQNMENLEWLALHGVRHQQVVGEVAGQTMILPARFGTIFSGEAALLKDVQSRKAALNKVFARISGADEWGVKVFTDRAVPAAPPVEAKSGKEYLQQKAARMQKRPERNDQELTDLATELQKIATHSAPSGKVSGAQPSLLWQATFLVPRTKRKEWDQALKKFVERWAGQRRIEVNGPWPPYSFVSDAE